MSQSLINATLLYANININKLYRVRKYYSYYDSTIEPPYNYIKRIANKPKYVIGSNAKFSTFNNVEYILKTLSNCGLGELDEWMKRGDWYSASSSYYRFKSSDNGITDNTMQYLLTGDETYTYRLDITLNIGLEQNRNQALIVFKELVIKTFDVLGLTMNKTLGDNITCFENYNIDFDNYIIEFECVKHEKIKWCVLSIKTKLYDHSSQLCWD
ncbi:MAG: hypothetical protein RR034_03270 [Bacteroidales bacterium]